MDSVTNFLIGHHDSKRNVPLSPALTQQAYGANYDMLTFPITAPRFHSRVLSTLSSFFANQTTGQGVTSLADNPVFIKSFSPVDTQLTPNETISSIVGLTSPWIDLSSPDPVIANVSRQVLSLELAYAAFCGVSYVIVRGPRGHSGADVAAYARAILEGLNQGPYMQLYIWTSTHPEAYNTTNQVGDLASFARREYMTPNERATGPNDPFRDWENWDIVRSVCKYSTRLHIALSLPKHLPQKSVLSRWYSEPVRILTLDGSIFRKNSKGYPSLPPEHQDYVLQLARLKIQPWFIVCDATPLKEISSEPGKTTSGDFPSLDNAKQMPPTDRDHHLAYLRHLQTKRASMTAMDKFGAGYQDYLQAPLQPLTVNLESITYEVFEKDPIKYEWYERATARALHDWIEQGKPTSNPDGRPIVAVVGAGRGPLVSRALKAAEDVGVDIDMWALEKNPNAFVLLQRHNETKWNNKVNLVKSDMRTWLGPKTNKNLSTVRKEYNIDPEEKDTGSQGPKSPHLGISSTPVPESNRYKIDILISELLGSFADNELSPECLDGVQHLLNPVHGISIPASYTAHFTPAAAPKLHADISLSMLAVNPTAAEIPYVVMLDQVDLLSSTGSTRQGDPVAPSPTKPKSFSSLFSNPSTSRQSSASARSAADISSNAKGSQVATVPVIHTAWEFRHPNNMLPPATASSGPSNAHNARHCKLSFPIPHSGTCHGIAGYFEAVLYPGVELSTNPLTMEEKSSGMISWFPIFFPFKQPIFLPENSVADISMWRQTDDRKVWYEWMLEVYISIDKGRRIKVGATDLHSSEKEACLM